MNRSTWRTPPRLLASTWTSLTTSLPRATSSFTASGTHAHTPPLAPSPPPLTPSSHPDQRGVLLRGSWPPHGPRLLRVSPGLPVPSLPQVRMQAHPLSPPHPLPSPPPLTLINVAYSSAALGLHMDLAYYESPPGYQFLHCLRYTHTQTPLLAPSPHPLTPSPHPDQRGLLRGPRPTHGPRLLWVSPGLPVPSLPQVHTHTHTHTPSLAPSPPPLTPSPHPDQRGLLRGPRPPHGPRLLWVAPGLPVPSLPQVHTHTHTHTLSRPLTPSSHPLLSPWSTWRTPPRPSASTWTWLTTSLPQATSSFTASGTHTHTHTHPLSPPHPLLSPPPLTLINVAYSFAALGLHMDLAYYESPPGYQFLHCLRYTRTHTLSPPHPLLSPPLTLINVAYSSAALGLHMDLAYYESPPGYQFLHCTEGTLIF